MTATMPLYDIGSVALFVVAWAAVWFAVGTIAAALTRTTTRRHRGRQ